MRAIAGAILAASGALLQGMTALAESACRVAETYAKGGGRSSPGESGYTMAWVLVLAGLAVLFLDFSGTLGRTKADSPPSARPRSDRPAWRGRHPPPRRSLPRATGAPPPV